ncbi:MAG: DUF2141 domain-containing protein [Candidatus Delongbacteria bacterium]|nr:DUF2141 domain-containing protein [Candidatus Delongbacteria bacterium]
MKLIVFIILTILNIAFSQTAPTNTLNVKITVNSFKSNSGVARLLIFNNDEGFPGEMELAIVKAVTTIENSIATFDLIVPSGEHAVVILHDENNNNEIDTAWYGKPIEGFGVSNDPKSSFGPPDYEDSTIIFIEEKKNFIITMRYF